MVMKKEVLVVFVANREDVETLNEYVRDRWEMERIDVCSGIGISYLLAREVIPYPCIECGGKAIFKRELDSNRFIYDHACAHKDGTFGSLRSISYDTYEEALAVWNKNNTPYIL